MHGGADKIHPDFQTVQDDALGGHVEKFFPGL